jgi:hypothetical protein
MFRKSTTGFKRILFLLLVPAVILLVRFRMKDLANVRDQTTWRSKPAEPEDARENDITPDGRV